jgi:hypothetical protein
MGVSSKKASGTRYIVDGVSMDSKTYKVYVRKRTEEILKESIVIDETTELVPGMRIGKKSDVFDGFMVVHEKGYRDGLILCLDDCGHSTLIPAFDGSYLIFPEGSEKVRIVYGSSPGAPLKLSNKYYYNEKDFIDKNPQYCHWYVEALHGTRRIVREMEENRGMEP